MCGKSAISILSWCNFFLPSALLIYTVVVLDNAVYHFIMVHDDRDLWSFHFIPYFSFQNSKHAGLNPAKIKLHSKCEKKKQNRVGTEIAVSLVYNH